MRQSPSYISRLFLACILVFVGLSLFACAQGMGPGLEDQAGTAVTVQTEPTSEPTATVVPTETPPPTPTPTPTPTLEEIAGLSAYYPTDPDDESDYEPEQLALIQDGLHELALQGVNWAAEGVTPLVVVQDQDDRPVIVLAVDSRQESESEPGVWMTSAQDGEPALVLYAPLPAEYDAENSDEITALMRNDGVLELTHTYTAQDGEQMVQVFNPESGEWRERGNPAEYANLPEVEYAPVYDELVERVNALEFTQVGDLREVEIQERTYLATNLFSPNSGAQVVYLTSPEMRELLRTLPTTGGNDAFRVVGPEESPEAKARYDQYMQALQTYIIDPFLRDRAKDRYAYYDGNGAYLGTIRLPLTVYIVIGEPYIVGEDYYTLGGEKPEGLGRFSGPHNTTITNDGYIIHEAFLDQDHMERANPEIVPANFLGAFMSPLDPARANLSDPFGTERGDYRQNRIDFGDNGGRDRPVEITKFENN